MIQKVRKFLAFTLVFMTFGLCLAKGGNSSFGMSIFAVLVSVLSLLFYLTFVFGTSSRQVRNLLVPAVLFLSVCVWGWLQTLTGVFPDLAHPVWAPFPQELSAIAADPAEGRFAVLRMITFGLLFLCLVLACEDLNTSVLVLRVIALLTTAIAVYGLYAYITGHNPVLGDLVNNKSVTGTFVNRNSFALFAAFGALANLAAFVDETAETANDLYDWLSGFFVTAWLYALGFLICSGALFLSFSRAGVAAAALGLLAFIFSWNRSNRGRLDWPVIGLCVSAFGLAALANASKVIERALTPDGEELRFQVYSTILAAIGDRPLFGHGIGSFHEAFRPYIPQSAARGEWTFAHNTYLETFMEFGAPAAILFYLALLWIVTRVYLGTRRHQSNRIFSCFAFGCIVAAAFHSIFDFSLQLPGNTALWAVILALGFTRGFSTRLARQ